MYDVNEGAATGVTHWRFTVDDYHRMGEVGILDEDDRVELIEGEIFKMAAIGGGHMGAVNRMNAMFMERLGRRAIVSVQNPVRLSGRTEPQPDVVLLRPRADFYSTIPEPEDVLLLIEVSDTTLAYDRNRKAPLYAAAGIVEVWILDLSGDRLFVYREPDSGDYRRAEILTRGQTVTPLAFPDVILAVDDVLGR